MLINLCNMEGTERMAAYVLACKAGAYQTSLVIRESTACYPQICKAAIKEIGTERVTDLLDTQEYPEWTYRCVRDCHYLFSAVQRARLVRRVAVSAENSGGLLRVIGNAVSPLERAMLIRAVATDSATTELLLSYHKHKWVTLTTSELALLKG